MSNNSVNKSRRKYNQWVANESIEDYSLRYSPGSFRKLSPGMLAHTTIVPTVISGLLKTRLSSFVSVIFRGAHNTYCLKSQLSTEPRTSFAICQIWCIVGCLSLLVLFNTF